MKTKVCTKCGEEKPATREFFYKHKAGYLGLQARCKVCLLAQQAEAYQRKKRVRAAEAIKRQERKKKRWASNKRWREGNPEKFRASHRRQTQRYRKNQPAAIYQIKNKKTGKIYIGATTAFPSRQIDHKSALRTGKHENSALQEDCNKYGLDVFEFEMIEEHPCDTEFKILKKIEEETIKRLLTEGKKLYNTILYSTR